MSTEEEKRQKLKEAAEKFARETKQTPNGKEESPEVLAETAAEYLPDPAKGAGQALIKNKRDLEREIEEQTK